MELARWLVAFVAFVTAFGGFLVDSIIPWSAAQHIKNPRWPPHAKFHNAQAILIGFALGVLALVLLFQRAPLNADRLMLSALLASIYWLAIFVAPIFPGTSFSDPEFASTNPSPMGIPLQALIGIVNVAILLVGVGLAVVKGV